LVAVLITAFLVWFTCGGGCYSWFIERNQTQDYDRTPEKDEFVVDAWLRAQDEVTSRLKSPGTADFGWQSSGQCVTHDGQGEYSVCGWVDCQNAFGATVRIHFTMTLERAGSGWRLVGEPVMIQR
jgi:hypothetical protein